MSDVWVNVDNQVFCTLNEHYDNKFAAIKFLGSETSWEDKLRSYAFSCQEHDGYEMDIYAYYSLDTKMVCEVYESPGNAI